MVDSARLLAVIPARSGSKGLPGKNVREFVGLPLIAHSILLAKACPEIQRVVVSTDSLEIAKIAQHFGADVPFIRPSELAQDETPIMPVLRHALVSLESQDSLQYDYLLLLEPTTPCRSPLSIRESFRRLQPALVADGIVGVSRAEAEPIWCCVVERNGWMTDLVPGMGCFERRQDVPAVYRINGSLYIWRAEFVRSQKGGWRTSGKYLMYEVEDVPSFPIDTEEQFQQAELLVKNRQAQLPWLSSRGEVKC